MTDKRRETRNATLASPKNNASVSLWLQSREQKFCRKFSIYIYIYIIRYVSHSASGSEDLVRFTFTLSIFIDFLFIFLYGILSWKQFFLPFFLGSAESYNPFQSLHSLQKILWATFLSVYFWTCYVTPARLWQKHKHLQEIYNKNDCTVINYEDQGFLLTEPNQQIWFNKGFYIITSERQIFF